MTDTRMAEPGFEGSISRQEHPETVEIEFANPQVGGDPLTVYALCDSSRTSSAVTTAFLSKFHPTLKLTWTEPNGDETFHTEFLVIDGQSESVILGRNECEQIFTEDDDEEPTSLPIFCGNRDDEASRQHKEGTNAEADVEEDEAEKKAEEARKKAEAEAKEKGKK